MTGTTPPAVPDETGALPSAAALHAYLAATGWIEQPPGRVGTLWAKGEATFGVPHENDEFILKGALARLAAAERRDVADVTRDILAAATPDPLVMPADEWTPEQIAEFREKFAAAMANPGPLRVLPNGEAQIRADERERIAARMDALAAASGDQSHFAYRNAAHEIRRMGDA